MFPTFEEFLKTESVQIPIFGFILNMVLAAILSYLLSRLYIRCGKALSNRIYFGENFMLMTMTTMLIISIVKASLALSLGLVGALSIVRFRAAIKEPEELAYLFLAIGIGLGFGADQRLTTLVAFFIISAIIFAKYKFQTNYKIDENLFLTIKSNPSKIDIGKIVDVLKSHCDQVMLKRLDENDKTIEASFFVQFSDFNNLEKAKLAIQDFDKTAKILVIDSKALA
jgi:hypothetical protein